MIKEERVKELAEKQAYATPGNSGITYREWLVGQLASNGNLWSNVKNENYPGYLVDMANRILNKLAESDLIDQ